MTPEDIFTQSIAVIDEMSDTGTVNNNQVKEYRNKTLPLLNAWHNIMVPIENITEPIPITSFTQTLQESDIGCTAGVYFLANHFAQSDQNTDLANFCDQMFNSIKKSAHKPIQSEDITDVYGIT